MFEKCLPFMTGVLAALVRMNQDFVLWVSSPQRRSTASQDIRTHEGWLYIAVVIDLFSRLVVGWSMNQREL
jgi:transposase InsO family protein